MNLSAIFIRRPVMTTLLMAALVIFGLFGYATLPVSELPNVDFPTIVVSANLPGADPTTMASAVATPLESQFSNIAGVDSMTSSSTQGQTTITIQFTLDRNLDGAAQDVQSAIAAAARRLPPGMPNPPTLRKVNPADTPIMFMSLRSDTLPLSKVDEYAETLLARQLSTLDGVAQVNVYGAQKFAVRIQADPAALAARQIGIDQLAAATSSSNVNIATGTLNGPTRQSVIHANGQLMNAADFAPQVVAYRNGAPVRFQDVAKVIDSVENNRAANWFKGNRAIGLSIQRQPGSNTIQLVDSINRILPTFLAQLPASARLETIYDRSQTIRDSISDVQTTLLIAGALVVGVIFVFLRRLTATFIPSIALPIAVIGTFAGMALFGYNLDNLSLMSLTLSVGFVVDDAIVMLENIIRHVEQGENPRDASFRGSREIAFTILSMTISLAAVFIPIVFMGGIIGRLLHEFAVTIILAILFSGIISVTLTPMLCSRILKSEEGEAHNAFYRWSERSFDRMHASYERTLRWSLNHRSVIVWMFVASLVAAVGLFYILPQDFLPADDTSALRAQTEAANGTSFDQMVRYQQRAAALINSDPNVEGAMSAVGGGPGAAGTNTGFMFIHLKPVSERPLGADALVQALNRKLAGVPGINVFIQNPPIFRIGGGNSKLPYQYTLQDLDLDELQAVSNRLTAAMTNDPTFAGQVTSDLNLSTPAVTVDIDRDKAAALGITAQQIESALGAAYGGQQVSSIYAASDQYQVILELLPQYQQDASALSRLYVAAKDGTLVPLNSIARIGQGTMPLSINHLGQIPSVTISFNLAPGKALSDAVTAINRISAQEAIPATVQTSFQGTAQAFQSSMSNMGLLLLIAIITVYIILGILYESFIHPLTILSGLPSAAVGALLTLWITGIPLSLYAFVGMMMLIGIVKKNAIMMIDFALHRQRDEGATREVAIFDAAMIRFRPIMMTTMAAMMGTLPIAIGLGAGADARRPLGLCVAGGLLLSQLLTLYITPVLYIYLDRFGDRVGHFRWRNLFSGDRKAQPAE
ncbi:MAG: efflux RND transporter permease subunit [Alphaproteobacteria bacterium]|nr:efflux RND transporter permease subunit [Alphaproteobacteria bacterium]